MLHKSAPWESQLDKIPIEKVPRGKSAIMVKI